MKGTDLVSSAHRPVGMFSVQEILYWPLLERSRTEEGRRTCQRRYELAISKLLPVAEQIAFPALQSLYVGSLDILGSMCATLNSVIWKKLRTFSVWQHVEGYILPWNMHSSIFRDTCPARLVARPFLCTQFFLCLCSHLLVIRFVTRSRYSVVWSLLSTGPSTMTSRSLLHAFQNGQGGRPVRITTCFKRTIRFWFS